MKVTSGSERDTALGDSTKKTEAIFMDSGSVVRTQEMVGTLKLKSQEK